MVISWALHFFSACTFIFGLATAQRPRPPRVELRATGCLWPTFSCGTNPSLEAPQVQMCVCVPVCVCVLASSMIYLRFACICVLLKLPA